MASKSITWYVRQDPSTFGTCHWQLSRTRFGESQCYRFEFGTAHCWFDLVERGTSHPVSESRSCRLCRRSCNESALDLEEFRWRKLKKLGG
jgi:heterodisulfide reductase subunit A-like polyferredoxin